MNKFRITVASFLAYFVMSAVISPLGIVSGPIAGMISFLIFNSALGTAVAPALSAVIVEKYDMIAALRFTSICYCVMIVLLFAAHLLRRRTAASGDMVNEPAF